MRCKYYLRRPERRAELGTDEALRRIRYADFGDVADEIAEYGDVRRRS